VLDVFLAEIDLDIGYLHISGQAADRADLQNILDGRDARDRLFGKIAQAVGHRADELAVDVDRAAAHAGDDPALVQFRREQLGDDQVLVGSELVKDAQHLEFEGFDGAALEDGFALAFHPGPDLRQFHYIGRRQQA
jgi:hypothetical protein